MIMTNYACMQKDFFSLISTYDKTHCIYIFKKKKKGKKKKDKFEANRE